MSGTPSQLRPSGPVPEFKKAPTISITSGIGAVRCEGTDVLFATGREIDVPVRQYSNVTVAGMGFVIARIDHLRDALVLLRPGASSQERADQVVPIATFKTSDLTPKSIGELCEHLGWHWHGVHEFEHQPNLDAIIELVAHACLP